MTSIKVVVSGWFQRQKCTLVDEIANVVLVLSHPILKVLVFADVRGSKLHAWSPTNDT